MFSGRRRCTSSLRYFWSQERRDLVVNYYYTSCVSHSSIWAGIIHPLTASRPVCCTQPVAPSLFYIYSLRSFPAAAAAGTTRSRYLPWGRDAQPTAHNPQPAPPPSLFVAGSSRETTHERKATPVEITPHHAPPRASRPAKACFVPPATIPFSPARSQVENWGRTGR